MIRLLVHGLHESEVLVSPLVCDESQASIEAAQPCGAGAIVRGRGQGNDLVLCVGVADEGGHGFGAQTLAAPILGHFDLGKVDAVA